MAGGLKLFTERSDDGAAGTPVLDTASGEELMHASSVVERYQKGYLVDFLSVSLHGVSRDPEAFESPCLHTQSIDLGKHDDLFCYAMHRPRALIHYISYILMYMVNQKDVIRSSSSSSSAHVFDYNVEDLVNDFMAVALSKVVGLPVTLNSDLKNQFVEAIFGFDTICKVNSQLISSDALSAEKYYYFIQLMGRKASHVILAEEAAASKLTIFDITKQICDAVQARAEQDKNHGVILLPEGLVESITEVYALLQETHSLL
ncbi:hypothetical protein R6Q57_002903 [Mikania cordata]